MAVATILYSCSADKRPLPKLSGAAPDIVVARFEQELLALDTTQFESELAALQQKHPAFTRLFVEQLLGAGALDSLNAQQLAFVRGFVADKTVRFLSDTAQVVFPNMDAVVQELAQGLHYFKHHFPGTPLPDTLTTFISAFNYGAVLFGDNDLALGLDMYLGEGFPYQKYAGNDPLFSNYLRRTYTPQHAASDLLRVLLQDVCGQQSGNRLLDYMIHNGKQLFLLKQTMPELPDTVLFKVTTAQMQWLQENEFNLWAHFNAEDLLYSSRFQDFRKLIEPSPSGAPILPEESPGQAANYIGYKIVEAFYEQRLDLEASGVAAIPDAQIILQGAKYKPSR